MTRLTTIPIFRRLFLAFFLAALLLNASLLLMSILYIGALRSLGMTQAETSPFVFATLVAMIVATAGVTGLGYLMNLTITQPLRIDSHESLLLTGACLTSNVTRS